MKRFASLIGLAVFVILVAAAAQTQSAAHNMLALQADPLPVSTPPPPENRNDVQMGNPATTYCLGLGYTYRTEETAEGQQGICEMPDGTACNQWDFLAGTCGAAYSYCGQQGFNTATRSAGENAFSAQYAVCETAAGDVIGAVTDLFDLEPKTMGCEGDDCATTYNGPIWPQVGMDITLWGADETQADLPDSFNWRDYDGVNWLTSIKNQNPCGSCWAFASIGVMEAMYNIAYDNPNLDLDLSEQYLVSTCFDTYGCDGGGSSYSALRFLNEEGVPDEACMPYQGTDMACSARCSNWSQRLQFLDGYGSVYPVNQENLKRAIIERGPVIVYMGISSEYGGYFDGNNVYRCSTDVGVNHAVVAVGYNDAGGYWIAKNSWGTGFGSSGYFKIGYGECALDSTVIFYAEQNPPLPATPTNLVAAPLSTDAMQLTWADNATTESAYLVERSPDGANWAQIGITSADATGYQDSALTCATTYHYRVRAFRELDGAFSDYSNIYSAATDICPPPNAPGDLQVTHIATTQLDLAWTDNASDETAFHIEHSTDGTTGWAEIDTTPPNTTTFEDVGLSCGTAHYYRVRAYRAGDGQYSAYTASAGAITLPCAPSDVQGAATSQTGIDLGWIDNSHDESAFHVERSPDGVSDWELAGTTDPDASAYSDSGLTCGTTYHYRVRAYRASDGLYSTADVIAVVTEACPPPNPPTGLVATTVSPTQIDLVWVDNTGQQAVYYVERTPGGTNDWTVLGLASAGETSYEDTSALCATSYDYRVRAYRSSDGQYSAYSSTASSATEECPPPPAPTGVQARAWSTAQIDVTWTDNAINETDYFIEHSQDGTTGWTQIAAAPADGTGVRLGGLTCSTRHYYRVRAYRSTDGEYSAYSTVADGITTPCAPTDLQVLAVSPSQIMLLWSEHSAYETAFEYEHSSDGVSGWLAMGAAPANSTSYPDVGLQCGTTYYYRLRAYRHDDGQYSAYTNVASATTAPCAPQGLVAAYTSGVAMQLTWTDRSSDETAFYVERSRTGSSGWSGIGSALPDVESFDDSGLTCSTPYYYRVRAYRGGDGLYSDYSTVAQGSTAPCAPDDLSAAAAGSDVINLAWTDHSGDETAFKVERSPDGSTDWAEVGSSDGDASAYQDGGLACSTTYHYRVRAFRAGDDGYSAYTNVASAKTASCAPQSLSAAAAGPEAVDLAWIDASDDETGFTIERSLSGAGDWSTAGSVGTGVTVFQAGGLTCGTLYDFRVRADRDAVFSFYSNMASAKTAPCAPSDLIVQGYLSVQVNLSWIDNAADESSFHIERSPDGSANWQPVGTAPADATTYSDSGLLCNTIYWYRVRAYRTTDAQFSYYSSVASGATLACPPGAPELLAPANGSQTYDNLPDFAWAAVDGASSYRVQISTESDFDSLLHDAVVTETGYTPPTVLEDGDTYYWRVASQNAMGEDGTWSAPWALLVDTQRPDAPALSKPKDGSTTADTTPSFKWKKVKNATLYRIQLSTDPAFGTTVAFETTGSRSFKPDALPFGVYYVRLQAYTGRWSDWGSVYTVTISALKAPRHATHTTDPTPTFSWASVDGAAQYHLQVDDDPAFASAEHTYTGSSTKSTSATLDHGVYYWRVQAQVGGVWREWTPVWMLTVTPGVPGKPQLSAPLNQAHLSTATPAFSWLAVDDGYTYQLQIDDKGNFSSPAQDVTLAPGVTSYVSAPLPDGGKFYWRVRAINEVGVAGAWSSKWKFTLSQLSEPGLLAPGDKTAMCDDTPTFTWNAVDGATRYQLQIDDDRKFKSPNQDASTTGRNLTAASLPDGKYYWRVRAVSTQGVPGDWSKTWQVTVDTLGPDAPQLSKPKPGSGTKDTTPRLGWKKSKGGEEYELEVAADAAFSDMRVTQTLTGTNYVLPEMLYGVYYWRVRARDAQGNWGGWSPAQSFSITLLKSPKDGDDTTNTRPTFKWNKVSGARQYHFELARDAAFNLVVADYVGGAGSFRPGEALAYGTYYWRVCVDMGTGCGAWMPTWAVVVTPKLPDKPRLVAPANKLLTPDDTPTFEWETVSGVTSYQLQVDDNSNFSSPLIDLTQPDELHYTAVGLPEGKLYWRVRAINSLGVPGKWSKKWYIKLDATPTQAPVLSAPADGAALTNKRFVLEWGKVTGAKRYELQIDSDPGFPMPAIDAGSKTKYKLQTPLARGLYYWHVRAYDKAGNASEWSETRHFTIVAGTSSALGSIFAIQPDGTRIATDSLRVRRIGTWTAQQVAGTSAVISSGEPGAALQIVFDGSWMAVEYVAGPDCGRFTLAVDDVPRRVVDCRADTVQTGVRAYVENLGGGAHTLHLEAEGPVIVQAFVTEP